MADLTKDEVRSLGKAARLDIQEPHLTEVTYNINALKELLDDLNPPGLDEVEPLPIIHPYQQIGQ
jgi:Asp-tRNA(Asn)/Glu-tRNA(Gln) amidotransferase C subunit